MKNKEELIQSLRFIFSFNHKEINAAMLLGVGIVVVLLIPALTREILYHYQQPETSTEVVVLDSLIRKTEISRANFSKKNREPKVRYQLAFDPNKASLLLFDSVGIPPWAAKGIVNYRSKGGKFRSKKDVQRMYGITDSIFAQIEPLIMLPDTFVREKKEWPKQAFAKNDARQPKPKLAPFDLNQADTFQLDKVFGIGMKTAKRIVKYRDELGGFLNYDQLHGIWGLDSLVIETLKDKSFIAQEFVPRKLKINLVSEEEMANHPFIRKSMARYLFRYRKQHGPYKSASDILNIKVINSSMVEKLEPYLSFEQP
jgi:DNA uptake protein ComE-like DNA-binding protein